MKRNYLRFKKDIVRSEISEDFEIYMDYTQIKMF